MKHIPHSMTYRIIFITFVLFFSLVGCRTHKSFTTDLSVQGLQNSTLGITRLYEAPVGVVQKALLRTFVHFGNRVNVEGALVDDVYFGHFSYLLAQGIHTQVQLYNIDLEHPMVFRATYPTHEVTILGRTIVKEGIHRVYLWVEALVSHQPNTTAKTLAKTRVRMLIDEEPPYKKYQISPRWPKYTEDQFFDYVDKIIEKVSE